MNIIANNCIGARIYQQCNKEYNNPFMWCVIQPDDMMRLILNFYKLNFSNIKIVQSNYYRQTEYYRAMYSKELQEPFFIFKCVIDNLVNIHYVHYRWNSLYDNPIKQGMDIYSNHIWDYVYDTYYKRVKRMIQEHITPTFVCNCSDTDYTLDVQKEIITTISKFATEAKIVLLSDYAEQLHTYYPIHKIMQLDRPIGTCVELANKYAQDIISL